MTATGSSRATFAGLAAAACGVALAIGAERSAFAEEPVLRLRATISGAPTAGPLTIELLRWSTDSERAPLLAALGASPPPSPAGEGNAATAGRGGAGRGGRQGRGRGPAPPATPADRLKAAIQSAPTVGFVWGAGPTGYSVKYAWHSPAPEGPERIVLATDRRLGAHSTSWPQAAAGGGSAEFTVIELRIGRSGAGEGKASLSAEVVVDSAAQTLALEGYGAAPVLFEVAR